jgi:hypothetical protein
MAVLWFKSETVLEQSAGEGIWARAAGWSGRGDDALDYDLVSRRAYELWVARGRPEGQSREIWHQAEAELSAQNSRRQAQALRRWDQALRQEAQRGFGARSGGE